MKSLHLLGVAAFAGIGGTIFAMLHVPLPWVLGGLAGASTYVNLTGQSIRTRQFRRAGQLILGTAAAAMLTPQIAQTLLSLAPLMVAAAIIANLVGLALVRPFCAIAKVDRTTGILSVLPAGMAEMASLAQERGAVVSVVTTTHIVRVLLIVTTLPLFLTFTVEPSDHQTVVRVFSNAAYVVLGFCILVGAALAWLAGKVGMLNPWIVAPMIVGLVLVLFGWEFAQIPQSGMIIAQIAIGGSLGSQILIRDFVRLPRVLLASLLNTLVLCLAMAAVGTSILMTDLDVNVISLMLALSPGGLGEMMASAQEFGANVAIVVGFQFLRSLLTNLIAPMYVGRV